MDTMDYKGNELITAIAYGDAAGLPVETRSAEYIENKYGTIHSLLSTAENDYFSDETGPGYWSDDTQLSIAVAKSLIRANGFDANVMAESHIAAYDETKEISRKCKTFKRGWGGSTVDAVQKLKKGVSPLESGTPGGAGNGVLMKISPLVYWQVARETSDEQRYAEYDILTNMTHDSTVARMTSRIHGDMLKHLIEDGFEKDTFVSALNETVAKHSEVVGDDGETKKLFAFLENLQTRQEILEQTDAKGFYAPQTLAMAYGAFLLNDGTFEDSVYEAVNLGGDTDSTGSIVAAMSVLASRKPTILPIDHLQLDQVQELKRTSRQLAHVAVHAFRPLA